MAWEDLLKRGPLTQAEHRERAIAGRASATARHRAETTPSVRQGSSGVPSARAVGLFRAGQSRPGRTSRPMWDTRTSEAPVGSINATVKFHFPQAYRSDTPDKPVPGGRDLAATLGGAKDEHRDVVVKNPDQMVEALRHPEMRRIMAQAVGVVRDNQVGTIDHAHERKLIPDGTRPGTVVRAYKHAALRAMHKAGLIDYDTKMDAAAKADLQPLHRFMYYAQRRVFDHLNQGDLKGKWGPFRDEFGQLYVQRKYGKPTGHTRMRMRPVEQFIKIEGPLDEVLSKMAEGRTAASERWASYTHAGGFSSSPYGNGLISPDDAMAQLVDEAAEVGQRGRGRVPVPPGGMPPIAGASQHLADAAAAVEEHFCKPGVRLTKRWDASKHPRTHEGAFASKRGERIGRAVGGGVGALAGLYAGHRYGPAIGAKIGRNTATTFNRAAKLAGHQSGIHGEYREMHLGGAGRVLGMKFGAKAGLGLGGIAGFLGGAAIGAAADASARRYNAVRAGKLDQYRRLNRDVSIVPSTIKQARRHIADAHQSGKKLKRGYEFVSAAMGKRAPPIAGMTVELDSGLFLVRPAVFLDQDQAAVSPMAKSEAVDLGFSIGSFNTDPKRQLARAIHPRMRRTRVRLRLNTQKDLRRVLSGGITRQERWQLGAAPAYNVQKMEKGIIADTAKFGAQMVRRHRFATGLGAGIGAAVGIPMAAESWNRHPAVRAIAGAAAAGGAAALLHRAGAIRGITRATRSIYDQGTKAAIREHLRVMGGGTPGPKDAKFRADALRAEKKLILQRAQAERKARIAAIKPPKRAIGLAAIAGGAAMALHRNHYTMPANFETDQAQNAASPT